MKVVGLMIKVNLRAGRGDRGEESLLRLLKDGVGPGWGTIEKIFSGLGYEIRFVKRRKEVKPINPFQPMAKQGGKFNEVNDR
mgnify:CR=1 FL=1